MDKELILNTARLIISDSCGYLPQSAAEPLSNFIMSVVDKEKVKTDQMTTRDMYWYIHQNYLFKKDAILKNLINIEPLNMGDCSGIIDVYSNGYFKEKGGAFPYEYDS